MQVIFFWLPSPLRLKFVRVNRTQALVDTQLICSWYFCSWNSTNSEVLDQAKFFARLGGKIRKLRKARGFSQEDMISFGFSARHWQQIEAGRPSL